MKYNKLTCIIFAFICLLLNSIIYAYTTEELVYISNQIPKVNGKFKAYLLGINPLNFN